MTTTIRALFAGLALTGLYACSSGGPQPVAFDQSAAEGVAQRFYQFQKAGDADSIDALFSSNYRESSTPQQRLAYLATVNERFGVVREVTIESWQSVHGLSTTDYELVYQVIRSKRIARETLKLSAEGNKLRISGYRLNSDGLILSDSLLTQKPVHQLR